MKLFKYKVLIALIAELILCRVSVAQDWKGAYDQAVNQYQSEQYVDALANAQKAYTASKTLDSKNQAYTIQLITVICLDSNQPDEGLKWITEEVALFSKLEGNSSKPYAEALRKHALFLQQKNKPKEAEAKCKEALTALESA
jgi:hypothetical protein